MLEPYVNFLSFISEVEIGDLYSPYDVKSVRELLSSLSMSLLGRDKNVKYISYSNTVFKIVIKT